MLQSTAECYILKKKKKIHYKEDEQHQQFKIINSATHISVFEYDEVQKSILPPSSMLIKSFGRERLEGYKKGLILSVLLFKFKMLTIRNFDR